MRPRVELRHVVPVHRQLIGDFLIPVDRPLLIRRRMLGVRLDDDVGIAERLRPFPLGVGQIEFAGDSLEAWIKYPSIAIDPAVSPRAGRMDDPVYRFAGILRAGRRDVRIAAVDVMGIAVPDDAAAINVTEGDALAVLGCAFGKAGAKDLVAEARDTTSIIGDALFAWRSAHILFQMRRTQCRECRRIPRIHKRLLSQIAHRP